MPRKAKIFLSYRRDDAEDVVGRIYDRLVGAFGEPAIFKDVDSIPIGVDFRKHLLAAVEGSQLLLVVIGPAWAGSPERQRIHEPNDFVRLEVRFALENAVPIIPVLVRNARGPAPDAMPEDIRELADRQYLVVRGDPDFHRDVDRLIKGIRRLPARASRSRLVRWPAALRTTRKRVLLVAALGFVGVALAASWLPARRAAIVDPAGVLRAE